MTRQDAMTVSFQCAALIALVSVGRSLPAAEEPLRTYTNPEYSYRLSYPASWHIAVTQGKGGPTLYSYSRSSAIGHGVLPFDGAEISTSPLPDLSNADGSGSLKERAEKDAKRFSQGGATLDDVPNPDNSDITDVVRVAYDYQRVEDSDRQRYVFFYFRLRGKPFVLGLNYWKDDPKAASYEQTLLWILKSIRNSAARPN